jgi:hypothetical protein
MKVLKILVRILLLLVLGLAITAVVARFHDGPISIFPGGPLVAGEVVATPVSSWTFADSIETIELQLVDDDTSRTVWVLGEGGRAYIPCSLGFPPGKTWHERADVDGRAMLRIDGKLYPVTLSRVGDEALRSRLAEIVVSKYGAPPPSDAGIWFFSIESRTP